MTTPPSATQPDSAPSGLLRYLLAARHRRVLRDLRRNAVWAAQARATPTIQTSIDGHVCRGHRHHPS
jgi:hypothetical protein